MKDALLFTLAMALYMLASSMDLQDAEREEAALAQHWIEIREANSGNSRNINTEHSVLNVRHSTF